MSSLPANNSIAASVADFELRNYQCSTQEKALAKEKFLAVMEFAVENPSKVSSVKAVVGSRDFFEKAASRYFKGRFRKEAPRPPGTVPDEMVSFIMHEAFGHPKAKLPELALAHQHAMAAENAVGNLLERYIASVLEPLGWIWCSGTLVTTTDFIKKDPDSSEWIVLQIKNRDNSENSSSSGFRNAKSIVSWFRTFNKTGNTNWSAFPVLTSSDRRKLSEEGFKDFVTQFYADLA